MWEYAELFKAGRAGDSEGRWWIECYDRDHNTVRTPSEFGDLLEALNKLSDDGWEVVTSYPSYRRSGPHEQERPEPTFMLRRQRDRG